MTLKTVNLKEYFVFRVSLRESRNPQKKGAARAPRNQRKKGVAKAPLNQGKKGAGKAPQTRRRRVRLVVP